jgi:hypothetical protein
MKVNKYRYNASADDFQKIPGSPIAYWVSEQIFNIFKTENPIGKHIEARQGLGTGQDWFFFRHVWEVSCNKIGYFMNSEHQAWESKNKWFPLNKGGSFRKWCGNQEYLIAFDILNRNKLKNLGNHLPSEDLYFKPAVSWSDITMTNNSFRYYENGYIFSNTGHCAFPKSLDEIYLLLAYCNNKFVNIISKVLNPTMHFHVGYFNKLPYPSEILAKQSIINGIVQKLLEISKLDWDSYETSWDFSSLPLLNATYRGDSLVSTYENLRAHWNEITLEMQRLEEENNRIFIEAYGLEDELTPDVPLKEITLTCNPYYRYGDNKSDSELEESLLADTMKELISYAVGCMFGRYSLDKPGLILANQGETYSDYCRLVPDSSFPADEDNAIPVLDGDWFSDDIVSRFRKFLRVAFGEDKYEENLRFVEAALGKDLRQYFLRDFYNDHVKRYKKRPIYWMFSSPDGSFNVLIYMHRYRPDTASIILSEYLREYQVRLSAYMDNLRRKEANPDLSKGEKVKALKELDKLRKTQDALTAYERDVLFPLANQRIEIDLDDGVKVNYPKFGVALKKIAGLEAKDEE